MNTATAVWMIRSSVGIVSGPIVAAAEGLARAGSARIKNPCNRSDWTRKVRLAARPGHTGVFVQPLCATPSWPHLKARPYWVSLHHPLALRAAARRLARAMRPFWSNRCGSQASQTSQTSCVRHGAQGAVTRSSSFCNLYFLASFVPLASWHEPLNPPNRCEKRTSANGNSSTRSANN